MPSQRSKAKIRFGGYLDRKLYRKIVTLAKKQGMEENLFGFMQKLISDAVVELEKKRDRAED